MKTASPNSSIIARLRADRAFRWLATALVINGILCAVITAVIIANGAAPKDALKATAPRFGTKLFHISDGTDSWYPMVMAYNREMADPASGMYSVFAEDKIKFQYPPSSLFMLDLIPKPLLQIQSYHDLGPEFEDKVGRVSQAAAFLTIFVSVLILELGLRRSAAGRNSSPAVVLARVFLGTLLGCTFYPLVKGHNLGQVQIYIDLLVAVGLLFYMLRWHPASGVCLGLCCLIKPEYGFVLVWGLVRRRWSFVLGMGGVLLLGFGAAFLRFGYSDNLEYLRLLHTISREGEVFWPNQSMNGFLNRLLLNGDPLKFAGMGYAEFDLPVYLATLLSSIAIFIATLWPSKNGASANQNGLPDLLIALVAATIASPIAWEHHYGIFLPIYAALLPMVLGLNRTGRWTAALLAVSFAGVANICKRPDLIFQNRWLGTVGSHIFFGGLLLFFLLLILRSRTAAPAGARMTTENPRIA